MPTITSRRVVVDVNIAQSAGDENAIHPTSKVCRDLLDAILIICHRVVITPDLLDEWQRHRSDRAARWLRRMYGRKKVVELKTPTHQALRRQIVRLTSTDQERAAMLKDVHLLEAALATDAIVISLDEAVRTLFTGLAIHVRECQTIHWLNPVIAQEDVLSWLEMGAPAQPERCLGYQIDRLRFFLPPRVPRHLNVAMPFRGATNLDRALPIAVGYV